MQIKKPYIASNSETYISLRQQELRTCKRISYEFHCEELFVVKHKTSYSCESAIYINLDTNIIKENCNFRFYYNKTDIIPTVLDGGDEIILPTWPSDKPIICTTNNDIPVKIPSHPYVLVNRSVLCNCSIEADNHYLKDFINSYTKRKEIFDLQERHETTTLSTSKNFFSNNHIMEVFMFISSAISLISTTLLIFLLCKHKKIRMLIAGLVLHQVKEVGATSRETTSECSTLAYTEIILTILSLIIVTFLHYRKSRFCKGYRFSNVVKIIFISDVKNYVLITLCKTAGSIHLSKNLGTLKAENIKLNKNYLWDTLEIDWKEVTVTFNGNKIDLPKIVVIKLQDKIKLRGLMNKEPLLFHLMLKQGIKWFTLAIEMQKSM